MEGEVIFDDDPMSTAPVAMRAGARSAPARKVPYLSKLVISAGFAKDQESAEKVLLGIAFGAFILSIALITFIVSPFRSSQPSPAVQAAIQRMQEGTP